MNKNTQMYVGAGVVLVAGYLLYNNYQKKQAAAKAAAATPKASFAGLDKNTVVGNRMAGMTGMTGMTGMAGCVESNAVIKDSRFGYNFAGDKNVGFISADGSIAPTFFNVQDSANSFR